MSQQQLQQHRQFQMVGGGNNAGGGGQFGDTTYTKIFVGGLAWETQRETMRHYFEQFGEIQEAVVITDKNTGRSKGYGFVTFKDPDAAMRACQDSSPVIDGRRANCNLASLGAQRPPPSSTPPPYYHHHHQGMGRYRPAAVTAGSAAMVTPATGSSYFQQPSQYAAYPYSAAYGYSGYSHDNIYPMNYYNVYGGGQQYSPYFPATTAAASAAPGVHPNYYPYYAHYAQSNQTQGYGVQYPQMVSYAYLLQQQQQHYNAPGIISLPTLVSPATTTTSSPGVATSASASAVISTTGGSTTAATTSTIEHGSSPA